MACLAGRVELDLLEAATGLAVDEVSRRLAPASTAGLLVLEPDARPSARFHHDRTQETVLGFLTPVTQRAERLRLARRLAGRDECFAVAAEQYLPVADAVHSAAERRLMLGLFQRAADQARVVGNDLLVARFLTAAVPLIDPDDADEFAAAHTELHAALYRLGRLEEADEEYRIIGRLCTQPAQRTAATVVQVSSLTYRHRPGEAMRLGLDHLRQLGLAIPDRDHLDAEIDRGLDAIYRWINQTSESDDLRRPAAADSSRLGAAEIISRLMSSAYFSDRAMMAWLIVTMVQMWARDGPDRALVSPACSAMFVTVARRHDYRTGHRVMRRILAVATARGYEPEMWEAQYLYAIGAGHWCDPLEDNLSMARHALEGLVRGGALYQASGAHFALVFDLLDCAPSLDVFVAEVDEALAFTARTGNSTAEEIFRPYRQLAGALRGTAEVSAADETAALSALADHPIAAAHLHATRALAAAILDHPAELARHTAAATPLLPFIQMQYPEAVARLLRALSLAQQARSTQAGQREATIAELDESVAWLAARASDAPANFLHLLRLVEAERAWAAGDFRAATYAFDVAQYEASVRTRPWHQALILERSAQFYRAHGMQQVRDLLLASARRRYADWGATAKVRQLDWANPTLRAQPAGAQPSGQPAPRPTVTTGTIDLLGIIAASQALSSETNIEGLRAKVVGVLSAMTGAKLSVTDQLTGLANRRHLDETLQAEWHRALRQKTPLAIAMIDIDHFKLYNDHFGHTAGDRCLQKVATCLAANTRVTDLIARYGGEEFALVMPDTETTAAARFAGRLGSAVEKLAEPHPLATQHVATVSIGVASITPTPDMHPIALVELADAALYGAKNGGRNRVETARWVPKLGHRA